MIRQSSRSAFTLIELLVVVAIIVVLIAILMPSLGKARAQAKSVKCLSNIKQIGAGIYIYAQENADSLPLNYVSTSTASVMGNQTPYSSDARAYVEWSKGLVGLGHVAPYLGIRDLNPANITAAKRPKFFVCPAAGDWKNSLRYTGVTAWNGSEGTLANFIDYLYWRDSVPIDTTSHFGLKLSQLNNRNLVYCMAAGDNNLRANGGHMDGSNFLFSDGHAEYLKRSSYTAYSIAVGVWWQEDTKWKR